MLAYTENKTALSGIQNVLPERNKKDLFFKNNNFLCSVYPDLRPLPDVAMTGKCTRECTEYGHSDSCWMPGQPSPNRTKSSKSGPKLSTFVPYQEREGQERLMADSSSKPLGEERSGGGGNKVASIRFLPPYTSAYSAGGDGGKDCPLEEIPLSQTADYAPATTPSSQGSKREIYL